ncbi:MAG: UDP-glucose--hexose-1-phosphate uridylyltransferase [Clostridia bacterium]
MIFTAVKKLVQYGIERGLLQVTDAIYATNLILEQLRLSTYVAPQEDYENIQLELVLHEILDYAFKQGLILDNSISARDLFDTKLMNALMPRPSEVITNFKQQYAISAKAATDYFYQLSLNSDYIRGYRISKDQKWKTTTVYGELDITVNLSKPEKDPKAIAAAKNAQDTGYPKCLLCVENEGYAGNISHPARNNHRIMPLKINQQRWGLQYSPYVYYNEHCIILNSEHVPMKLDKSTFVKLFDFVKLFPHYFIGSNADLPIVGGSILSHDHFQGGNYQFAMEKAPIELEVKIKGFSDIEAGIVKWPLSVLRLRCEDEQRLIELADYILTSWKKYSDEQAFIFAHTNGEPHNTITPIARKIGQVFELDLALRNNITTQEYPQGVYHPHAELHHIKKENIGLIEVMGLAVLPARLKEEMEMLKEAILTGSDLYNIEPLVKHADWANGIIRKYPIVTVENIDEILQEEIGLVFMRVLEDAGVYKCTAEGRKAFIRMINSL